MVENVQSISVKEDGVEVTYQSCSGRHCEHAAEGLGAVLVHQQPIWVASPIFPSDLEKMPNSTKKKLIMDHDGS